MFAGSSKELTHLLQAKPDATSGGKKRKPNTKTVASRNTGKHPPPASRRPTAFDLKAWASPKSTEPDPESTVAESPASSESGGTVVQTPATHGHTRAAATPVCVDKYPTDPKDGHYQSYMSSKDTIVFPGAVRARAKQLAASARTIGHSAMQCKDKEKKAALYKRAVLEQAEAKRLEASIVDTLAAHDKAVVALKVATLHMGTAQREGKWLDVSEWEQLVQQLTARLLNPKSASPPAKQTPAKQSRAKDKVASAKDRVSSSASALAGLVREDQAGSASAPKGTFPMPEVHKAERPRAMREYEERRGRPERQLSQTGENVRKRRRRAKKTLQDLAKKRSYKVADLEAAMKKTWKMGKTNGVPNFVKIRPEDCICLDQGQAYCNLCHVSIQMGRNVVVHIYGNSAQFKTPGFTTMHQKKIASAAAAKANQAGRPKLSATLQQFREKNKLQGQSRHDAEDQFLGEAINHACDCNMSLRQLDKARPQLEKWRGIKLAGRRQMAECWLPMRNEERQQYKRLFAKCWPQFAVCADGTPNFAAAEAVELRYVTLDFQIVTVLVALRLLEKTPDGDGLAGLLEDTLQNEYGLLLHNWRVSSQDRASVNQKAIRQLIAKHPAINALLMNHCNSHTIANAGAQMKSTALTLMMQKWTKVVNQSPKARKVFSEAFAEAPKYGGGVRWWIEWELVSQLTRIGLKNLLHKVVTVCQEKEFAKKSSGKLAKLMRQPDKMCQAIVEGAAVAVAGHAFCCITYFMEGDKPLVFVAAELLDLLTEHVFVVSKEVDDCVQEAVAHMAPYAANHEARVRAARANVALRDATVVAAKASLTQEIGLARNAAVSAREAALAAQAASAHAASVAASVATASAAAASAASTPSAAAASAAVTEQATSGLATSARTRPRRNKQQTPKEAPGQNGEQQWDTSKRKPKAKASPSATSRASPQAAPQAAQQAASRAEGAATLDEEEPDEEGEEGGEGDEDSDEDEDTDTDAVQYAKACVELAEVASRAAVLEEVVVVQARRKWKAKVGPVTHEEFTAHARATVAPMHDYFHKQYNLPTGDMYNLLRAFRGVEVLNPFKLKYFTVMDIAERVELLKLFGFPEFTTQMLLGLAMELQQFVAIAGDTDFDWDSLPGAKDYNESLERRKANAAKAAAKKAATIAYNESRRNPRASVEATSASATAGTTAATDASPEPAATNATTAVADTAEGRVQEEMMTNVQAAVDEHNDREVARGFELDDAVRQPRADTADDATTGGADAEDVDEDAVEWLGGGGAPQDRTKEERDKLKLQQAEWNNLAVSTRARLGLSEHDVRGDGSCWVYAVLANLGLLEHRGSGAPSAQDLRWDARVRKIVWCSYCPSVTWQMCQGVRANAVLTSAVYTPTGRKLSDGEWSKDMYWLRLVKALKTTIVIWTANRPRQAVYQFLPKGSFKPKDGVYAHDELEVMEEDTAKCYNLTTSQVETLSAQALFTSTHCIHVAYNGSNHYDGFTCKYGQCKAHHNTPSYGYEHLRLRTPTTTLQERLQLAVTESADASKAAQAPTPPLREGLGAYGDTSDDDEGGDETSDDDEEEWGDAVGDGLRGHEQAPPPRSLGFAHFNDDEDRDNGYLPEGEEGDEGEEGEEGEEDEEEPDEEGEEGEEGEDSEEDEEDEEEDVISVGASMGLFGDPGDRGFLAVPRPTPSAQAPAPAPAPGRASTSRAPPRRAAAPSPASSAEGATAGARAPTTPHPWLGCRDDALSGERTSRVLTWHDDPAETSRRIWEWWRLQILGRNEATSAGGSAYFLQYVPLAVRMVVLVQPSSASVERIFSQLKFILDTVTREPLRDQLEYRLFRRVNRGKYEHHMRLILPGDARAAMP